MDQIFDTITIGDVKYVTRKMNPLKAIELHAEALATFGPAVGPAINTIELEDLKGDGAIKAGINAIVGIIGYANTAKLPGLIQKVMEEITPEMDKGERGLTGHRFDQHFQQYPGNLYPVFAWGLLLNITPFLSAKDGLTSVVNALGLGSQTDTKPPGPFTGQSGKE